MNTKIHHHYNKTRQDAQAKGERKQGIFWQEGVLLLSAAVFCLFCLLGPSLSGGVRTAVERQSEAAVEETGEEARPDSLLPGERIDLNTAPEKDLQRLPGIGESRAREIVRDRRENGDFASIEDITRVYGIGAGILEQIRPYVTLGGD